MAWYLRAVETDHGRWSCQWGTLKYDEHTSLEEATTHLRDLASVIGLSVLFVHPLRGPARRLEPRISSATHQP